MDSIIEKALGKHRVLKVLNIGCGVEKYAESSFRIDHKHEVIGLDMRKFDGVDVVHDINDLPLPFKNEEFDMIVGRYIIEYVIDVNKLFMEIHRILKPNGKIKLIIAHHSNPYSYTYQVKSRWSMMSFDNLDNIKKQSPLSDLFKITKKIKLVRPFGWLEGFVNRFPSFYEWRLCGLLPAKEIHFTLKKVRREE